MVKMVSRSGSLKIVPTSLVERFKGCGYSVYKESVKDTADVKDEKEVGNEKPLSKWTKEELKTYTKEHNIDTSSCKNPKEVKELIKAHMES